MGGKLGGLRLKWNRGNKGRRSRGNKGNKGGLGTVSGNDGMGSRCN